MSIGPHARSWLSKKHGANNNKTYTSKYYTPEESWPKTHVWWLQVPLKVIETSQGLFINLVCQIAPNAHDYHYLQVPVQYFKDHLNKFDIVQGKMIHLYLSADPKKIFLEERGTGNLDFSVFRIT